MIHKIFCNYFPVILMNICRNEQILMGWDFFFKSTIVELYLLSFPIFRFLWLKAGRRIMILFVTVKKFNIWIIFCRFIYSISPYGIRSRICGGIMMVVFAVEWWFITTAITTTITTMTTIKGWVLKTLWFFWQIVFLLIVMILFLKLFKFDCIIFVH